MCASTAVVVVSANPRLAWWALLRWVSVSQPLGVVFLVGLLVGGQGWDVALASRFHGTGLVGGVPVT